MPDPLNDHEKIAELVAKKLMVENTRMWVDREMHYNHHSWVKRKIEEDETSRRFKQKVIHTATIWAIFPIITFIGVAVVKAIVDYINHQGPTP